MAIDLKDRKKIIIPAVAGIIVIIILIAVFFPSGKKEDVSSQDEVISKRVRLDIQEEKPAALSEPAPAEVAKAETATPETKPEVKPETAKPVEVKEVKQAVKEEAPRAERAVEKPQSPIQADGEKKISAEKKPKAEIKQVSKSEKAQKKSEAKAKKTAASASAKAQKAKLSTAEAKALALKPYAVNVASFPSLNEAKALIGALKSSGYKGYITEFSKEGVKWYRVRVGFYRTREEAEKAGSRIEDKFRVQSPWIVKPTRDEAAGHIK